MKTYINVDDVELYNKGKLRVDKLIKHYSDYANITIKWKNKIVFDGLKNEIPKQLKRFKVLEVDSIIDLRNKMAITIIVK